MFNVKRLISFAALILPGSAWAADTPTEPYPYWGPHMMWGGGAYGMMFGPIFMLIVLAVVIAAAVLIVRSLGGSWHAFPHHQPPGRTALDILKERFARGEIDKNEFEERRRVLGE